MLSRKSSTGQHKRKDYSEILNRDRTVLEEALQDLAVREHTTCTVVGSGSAMEMLFMHSSHLQKL